MPPAQIARYYNLGALGSFSESLMKTIAKADLENREKLRKCFPEYVEGYELWVTGDYEQEENI